MKWYTKYLQVYEKPFAEAPAEIIRTVRDNVARVQSAKPVVTVSVIGYNEERHLLACLWSLSEQQSRYPLEIIGVDNNSKDRTADIFEMTGVPLHLEIKGMPDNVDSTTLEAATTSTSMPTRCIHLTMSRRWSRP